MKTNPGEFYGEQITIDHKPDLPEETKRAVAAGLEVINSRISGCISVSRAIGDW